MGDMGSEQLPPLPYVGHNGRELGLMLRGTKPLAYFLDTIDRESDIVIRYWRMFDRHVAAGRLIKREVFEVLSNLEHRRLLYALPGHEWRIDAMNSLMDELRTCSKAWSDDQERRSCELLGYEGWQIDHWLTYRRARRAVSSAGQRGSPGMRRTKR